MAPFPNPGPSVTGGIAFASLPSRLRLRMNRNMRNATRQETATTDAITMPAMAPEARCEDEVEALGLPEGLDSCKAGLEALGLLDGLDPSKDEDVVASVPDQQICSRLREMDIPLDEIVDEVAEMLLGDDLGRLLEDVDEDSTALALAIETFAFGLSKLVRQTLIWFLVCVQSSYS